MSGHNGEKVLGQLHRQSRCLPRISVRMEMRAWLMSFYVVEVIDIGLRQIPEPW